MLGAVGIVIFFCMAAVFDTTSPLTSVMSWSVLDLLVVVVAAKSCGEKADLSLLDVVHS